jgi:hypothetical protein
VAAAVASSSCCPWALLLPGCQPQAAGAEAPRRCQAALLSLLSLLVLLLLLVLLVHQQHCPEAQLH